MTTYNDVILADRNLNNVTSIPIDYYTIASYVLWEGCIYNDTVISIVNCLVSTSDAYVGMVSISGGGVVGYQEVTSDLNATCTLGAVPSGDALQIIMRICITGGLTGCQSVPLYISK